MERTLGLQQERFFWPTMADDVHVFIFVCVFDARGSSNPKKALECDQYWFLILWS